MATFNSQLIRKRTKHRGIYGGQEYTIEGIIRVPSGTVLTTADVFRFVPLGENQVVTQVWAYVLGASGATAVSIGYAQRLGPDGQPEVVDRNGPLATGGEFTSPATNLTAFAPAAVLTTARRVVDTTVEKLTGPVDLAAGVTTGATLAADIEIHVGAVIVGEINDLSASSGYPGNAEDIGLL